MRAKGVGIYRICMTLNDENIPIPSDYYYKKIGKPNPRHTRHLWTPVVLRRLLQNPIYLGHLVQLRTTTVSYKNHKRIDNDGEDMVVVENTHEPIITQEIWDKVREVEKSVSQGKKQKSGETAPLSGLMFCIDCGAKMRVCWNNTRHRRCDPYIYRRHNFNCQNYTIFGKKVCTSHYIKIEDIEELILLDIRSMAKLVIDDEEKARANFLKQKEQQTSEKSAADKKKLTESNYRLEELSKLMQAVYEDKVLGRVPEDVCVNLLEKYELEKKELTKLAAELETSLSKFVQNEKDVDEFIRRLKKYYDVEKLTREMCLELIEYVTVDAYQEVNPREIQIYYKFITEPLKDKKTLYPY